ncbi:hypothetical protein GGR57DRAFT_351813 [Xylariaceae sp. FL1272]|nr:hypothetical protein GGR57DRAFT_351813 [Xylariaceae sp. FL1272]
MDSKLGPDELPPPYTAHENHEARSPYDSASITSHLQQHLTYLPGRIWEAQQTRCAQQSMNDTVLLDALLPEIERFLSHLGSLHNPPPLAQLTLIPDAAVPRTATLSGMDEMRRRGEICQLSRVTLGPDSKQEKEKALNDNNSQSEEQKWSQGQEFSDWGRFGNSDDCSNSSVASKETLWWKDESMARRLANYLQPPATKQETPRLVTPVQTAVEERLPAQKEKKGWLWGMKAAVSNTPRPTRDVDIAESASRVETKESQLEGTKMNATAQEVAFRCENDFGIIESTRGWAIAVVVRIKA